MGSLLKHIKLGRINTNHVINPDVVNGTSGLDTTRHRTESVAYIKCCLINVRLIISKTNMLQSMLLEGDTDICAIIETWITLEEETNMQARLVPSRYVIKSTSRLKHWGGGKTVFEYWPMHIPSSQWNAPHTS